MDQVQAICCAKNIWRSENAISISFNWTEKFFAIHCDFKATIILSFITNNQHHLLSKLHVSPLSFPLLILTSNLSNAGLPTTVSSTKYATCALFEFSHPGNLNDLVPEELIHLICTYGWNFSGRTEHGIDVIFLVFLATVFGNLEVWKVKKWNIFLKYISAGV